MNLLMTGAAGMLADAVCKELSINGDNIFGEEIKIEKIDINIRKRDINKVNICDIDNLNHWVNKSRPDLFLHLAAETDVDLCQKDPNHAYKTNTIGTENCAILCQKNDIPMIYISTAAVFDGEKAEPYIEYDDRKPVNIYGWSKYYGELIVQQLLRKYYIIRAGWMIGGWEIDKKFVFKIVKQLLSGKKELSVVNDKFGSPTFTTDFAKNLLPLIKTNRFGVYHMANKGVASRFEIADRIVEFMGMKNEVSIIPVCSELFPLPAPRSRSEMMKNQHLELIDMNNMPNWEISLKQYIEENIDHINGETFA